MSPGIIIGKVNYYEKTVVKLSGIFGNGVQRLEYYNVRNGIMHNIGLYRTDENGVFGIPFKWNTGSIGEISGAVFRVTAFDQSFKTSRSVNGIIHTGSNMHGAWHKAGQSMLASGLLEVLKFNLASSVLTVFTNSMSIDNKFAVGLIVIDL